MPSGEISIFQEVLYKYLSLFLNNCLRQSLSQLPGGDNVVVVVVVVPEIRLSIHDLTMNTQILYKMYFVMTIITCARMCYVI